MKAIIMLCLICLTAFTSEAQTALTMTNPNGMALDTATQAAAEGSFLRVNPAKAKASIVIKTTKISGTIAGNIKWQGSLDGTNYVTISQDTLVDATNNYAVALTSNQYLFYKALITQTGTSSMSYSGKALFVGQQ